MRTPRVLFVKYHEAADQQPMSRRAAEKMGLFPSLSLGGLAALLRREGYPVGILDLHAENLLVDQAEDRVRSFDPQVVGITCKTLGWPAVIQVAQMVRRAAPKAIVVVGGPHMSIYPEETLTWDCFDLAVVGDGEETLLAICDRVAHGGEPWDVPGTLARKPDGEVVRNPPRPWVRDLDAYPFTAFDLMPMERYHGLTVLEPLATMVTSRGCPWHCGYCSQVYSEKLRFRSPEHVVEEMAWLERRFGVREIIMFDETFTIGKARMMAFSDEVLRRGLKVKFNIRARVDTVDAEVLRALKRAGLRSIHMGVEAGTDRLLKIMNKQITRAQAEQAFREARETGIETRGYFMIGYPDATAHDIEETIRFACGLGLDWASFSVATILPATDLYRIARERGYVQGDPWREYTLDGGGPIPQLETETFTAEALRRYRTRAYVSFYLRPELVLRKIARSEDWREIREMLGGAVVLSEIVKSTALRRVPQAHVGKIATV
ncbi:MAG: radical SAM protein [Deltaproteobacteria bacterium]|nr:radical SAM protein [Deltaproteobacteria bacterium]